MIQTNRRQLITGLISFIAAPAIVRAGSLMPVKAYNKNWIYGRFMTIDDYLVQILKPMVRNFYNEVE